MNRPADACLTVAALPDERSGSRCIPSRPVSARGCITVRPEGTAGSGYDVAIHTEPEGPHLFKISCH
jgi:hypothetical protein